MNYEDFLTAVCEAVKLKFTEGGKVTINHVIKNNDTHLDGLVIMEDNSNVAPTIYLNDYYEQYCEGRQFEEIIDCLIQVYEKNKDVFTFSPDIFSNYEYMKEKIVYKVINYDKNKDLLKDVPHKRILDLAVVFYCLIEQREDVNATAMIHNSHLKSWGITENDLYNDAIKNTPLLLKSTIRPMSKILKEMLDEEGKSSDEDLVFSAQNGDMYVLTNSSKMNGAACMLYDSVLERFANVLGTDLYILPSSVHEVILLPKNDTYNKDILAQMVREVNMEGVPSDEILSDNVYEYNRKDGLISI